MQWIHDLPSWQLGPICVLAFVLVTAGGLWLAYRNVHQRLKVGETLIDNGVVGWFFSGIFTLYGITLGLIAVTTWESYTQVSAVASREAAAIAALYRDTSGFPSPLREEYQKHLRDYTRYIIEKVWPAQRHGVIVTDGDQMLEEFQRELFENEPKSDSQRILQAEALKAFNELIEFRRERTVAVSEGVPSVVWTVILLGGLLTIVSSFCFQPKQFKFHLLLSTGLAVMIGLLVFLIATLDQPYRGTVSVEPTAYEIVLERVMTNSEAK